MATQGDVFCGQWKGDKGLNTVILYSWARPRGAQLTAGYTVNTYSKPSLYYTLGAFAPLLRIIHSALARLAWRAYCLRTPAVRTHGTCVRTAQALAPGGALPTRTD